MSRDYQQEHLDVAERQYAYNFDAILRRYMMKTFEPLLPRGKALELGCYKGEVTALIHRYYEDLTVIEAASDLAAEVAARFPRVTMINRTFEEASLEHLYDAIFFVHTLEHIDDPAAVLRRVGGWLTEGGRLFLVCPNANAPSRQIAVKMGLISHNAAVTEGEAKHGHRRTYALDSLERDAVAAGLEVESRGGIFFKGLANFQFDKLLAMGDEVISQGYLDGCYKLGMIYPDLCASVYVVCRRPA